MLCSLGEDQCGVLLTSAHDMHTIHNNREQKIKGVYLPKVVDVAIFNRFSNLNKSLTLSNKRVMLLISEKLCYKHEGDLRSCHLLRTKKHPYHLSSSLESRLKSGLPSQDPKRV